MECCGESFAVHDIVEWDLVAAPEDNWLPDVIGDELASRVTHHHDRHGPNEGARRRRGKVLGIRCAYSRYAPSPGGDQRTLHPVAGTSEIVPVDRVDGRERRSSSLNFNGYLVELELALGS